MPCAVLRTAAAPAFAGGARWFNVADFGFEKSLLWYGQFKNLTKGMGNH